MPANVTSTIPRSRSPQGREEDQGREGADGPTRRATSSGKGGDGDPSGARNSGSNGGGDEGEQGTIYKAISRVHRACTSCRKQKARCEGPEHPPCRRCKAAGIECIFEKPPREAQPGTADAGSERIRTLENQMSDMQTMMGELVNTLKTNTRLLAQQVHASSASPMRPPHGRDPYAAGPSASHPAAGFRPPVGYHQAQQRVFAPRTQDLLQQPTTAQHSQYLQREGDNSPSARSESERRVYPWSAHSPRSIGGVPNAAAADNGSSSQHWRQHGRATRSSPALNQRDPLQQQSWSHAMGAAAGEDRRSRGSAGRGEGTSASQHWRQSTPPGSSMPPPPTVPRPAGRNPDDETDLSNDQLSAPIEALRGLADAAAAAADADRGAGEDDDFDDIDGEDPTSSASGSHRYANDEHGAMKGTSGARSSMDGGAHSKQHTHTRHAPSEDAGTSDEASSGPRKRRRADTSSTTGKHGSTNPADDVNPHGVDRPGDLVTLGLVTSNDARRLFDIFAQGVPKFISISHFDDVAPDDAQSDAMESIRTRSYFLYNVILAIGAQIECGGGPKSRLFRICMAQAKRNAKDTLFMPVDGREAVQAMVLLGSYSDNTWLPTGLSIRMAQELGLDRSFQRLMTRLPPGTMLQQPAPPRPPRNHVYHQGSPSSLYTESPTDRSDVSGPVGRPGEGEGATDMPQGTLEELRELARGARLWFFLFLFDHQASFGAGRPAMLSKHYVRNCRAFLTLQYPLTVDTDARFISTLELLIIRETHYDAMAPYDQPVDAAMLSRMRSVTHELDEWHKYWSGELAARGYDDSSFFQQSLILQCASAELYLTCTALRGIKDSYDAGRMGPEQRELIIQATRAADTCLSISVNSHEYREMLGWAPHYTHVTAAFACVFLIKIARLFPRQVDTYGIFSNAERLATRLAEVPATKYSRVIRILLAQAWKKIADMSPSIGLYAALGAEGSRPGAITPAEIKVGGPSDTGLALLYKLLAQHQQSAEAGDGNDGEAEPRFDANTTGGDSSMAGADQRLDASNPAFKWNTATAPSPQVGATSGVGTPSRAAAATTGSAIGGSTGSALGWRKNSTAGPDSDPWGTPSVSQPLQLPLWMQESTGSLLDSTSQLRDWSSTVAGYSSDTGGFGAAGGMGNGHTPIETPGMAGMQASGHQPQAQVSHGQQQTQQLQGPVQQYGQHQQGGTVSGAGAGLQLTASNFDSVLSDLGLPIDGLDILFFDHPTVEGGAQ